MFLHGLVVQAIADQGLLPDVGDEHVSILQQVQQDLLALSGLEVQGDELLAAVMDGEQGVQVIFIGGELVGAGLTHHVAVQGLHLDDVGAIGGQDTGGGGGCHHGAHFHDLDALQGQSHLFFFHYNWLLAASAPRLKHSVFLGLFLPFLPK